MAPNLVFGAIFCYNILYALVAELEYARSLSRTKLKNQRVN